MSFSIHNLTNWLCCHNFIMSSPVLGADQRIWMRMYDQINLSEWRLEILGYDPSDVVGTWSNRHREFVYVGNSSHDPQRHEKLLQNKHCFWPDPPVRGETTGPHSR